MNSQDAAKAAPAQSVTETVEPDAVKVFIANLVSNVDDGALDELNSALASGGDFSRKTELVKAIEGQLYLARD